MKEKISALCKSFLWCVCILLFPVVSGTMSVVLSLETIEALFLQGAFMLASLLIPLILVLTGRWKWNEIGFCKYDVETCKKALYFLPLFAVLIPVAIKGFYFKSTAYMLGSMFLYLTVGIAEEVYFRGIIPKYLNKVFSLKGMIFSSAVVFGMGHMAAAFTASSGWEIFLTVLNAFIFGWLAIEMTVISKNITTAILLHFLFDFETKIVVMSGSSLLIAECVRGAVMVVSALWLATVIKNEEMSQGSM